MTAELSLAQFHLTQENMTSISDLDQNFVAFWELLLEFVWQGGWKSFPLKIVKVLLLSQYNREAYVH